MSFNDMYDQKINVIQYPYNVNKYIFENIIQGVNKKLKIPLPREKG